MGLHVVCILSTENQVSCLTMPYLNFVEKSSQGDLIWVFPQLFRDLSEGKLCLSIK